MSAPDPEPVSPGYASTYRIYFHEVPHRGVEKGLVRRDLTREKIPRSCSTTARPGILLSLKGSCAHNHGQRETHNR